MDCRSVVWHVKLLGGLNAVLVSDGSITHFRSHKVGALLAYMALFPRHRHNREELAEMLWPEAEAGRVNLRTVLSSLRRELEPEGIPAGSILITRGHTEVYLAPSAVETDVARFERALSAAEQMALSLEERIQRLAEAVALYEGPLLPGFYENWVLSERERLTTRYLDALGRLSHSCEQAGDIARAMEFARRAVEADPLYEDGQTSLIRLRAAGGDRVGALRQYREWERLLKEQLSVEPGPESRRLFEALKGASSLRENSVSTLRGAAQVGASPTKQVPSRPNVTVPSPFPVRLPSTFTAFCGREEEEAALFALLRSGETRLATITGPGGCGKTRLAIETARQMTDYFGGGILFVPLADLREAERLPEAIADTLGLPRSAALPLPEQIAGALNAASAPVLLVLDNFEQIVDGGAVFVQTLFAAAPMLRCLVTSRHRLLIESEREFTLAPLPVPEHPGTPQRLLEFSSVQLFVHRARAARGDFELNTGNAAAVAELCTRLEGIPLALELAAAWAQTLTAEQILERLGRGFDLLVARRRDVPARHATLRATIAWGVDLLSPDLKVFFTRLSAFRGGFSLEAAEEVCEEPNALTFLADLCDHSLLIVEPSLPAAEADAPTPQMRYRMLETVREFAEELRLQRSEEEQAALNARHAAYFVRMAEEAEPHLRGSRQQRFWFDYLQTEQTNLHAALEWTRSAASDAGAGKAVSAHTVHLRLCSALSAYWLMRGHLAEAERWLLQNNLILLAHGMPDMPASILAPALYGRAEIAHIREEVDISRDAMERSLTLYREAGNKSGEGRALARLARRDQRLSYQERRRMARVARRLCRAAGDPQAEADVLTDQAWLIRCQVKNYPRAHQFMSRAVALYRSVGDTEHAASALRERGTWYAWGLQLEPAEALLNEALALARQLNNRREIGFILWSLGYVTVFKSELVRAIEMFREGAQIAQAIGDEWCLLLNLTRLALALLGIDKDTEAETVFFKCLPIARRTSECTHATALPEVFHTYEGLAMIAARRGDLRRAARLLGAAWPMGRPGPDGVPTDYDPMVTERYTRMMAQIYQLPGRLLAEWERGRALCPAQADAFALRG
jgi:predicted ATPase/DNA-binding SARP family transcriptional activator